MHAWFIGYWLSIGGLHFDMLLFNLVIMTSVCDIELCVHVCLNVSAFVVVFVVVLVAVLVCLTCRCNNQ